MIIENQFDKLEARWNDLIKKFEIASFLEQAYISLVIDYMGAYKSVETKKLKTVLGVTDDKLV